MKFILPILVFAWSALAQIPPPKVYSVTTRTNGILASPANFFGVNSNKLWQAISNKFQPAPFRTSTNNNLYLSIDGGTVVDAAGNRIVYDGASVLTLANKTNYICLDIGTWQVNNYPRLLDTGSILLAVARTDSSKVTNVYQPSTFTLPRSRIETFKRKLLGGALGLKVTAIGDSLMQYTAGEANWVDQVFSNNASGYGFTVPYVTNIVLANYAAGGQDPRYGLAVLGRHWMTSKIPGVWSNGLNSLGINYGPYYGQFLTTGSFVEDHMYGNRPTAESPVIADAPDLALVCFYNHTTDQTGYIESIVRKLKKRGCDVVLYSAGPLSTDGSVWESDGYDLARIADAYGCEFVDMWARQRSRVDYSIPIFADTLHPNSAGLALWAASTRAVVNTLTQESEKPPFPGIRVVRSSDATRSTKFPETMDLIAWPGYTESPATTTVLTTGQANLALLYGGKVTTNAVYSLSANQGVAFGHANPLAWDLLVEGNSGFTANIMVHGVSHKTITYTSGALAPIVVTGFTMDDVIDSNGYFFGSPGLFDNAMFGVRVTAGTAKIIGFIVHSVERREVAYQEMSFMGTWATGDGPNIPLSRYTDTTGDSFSFPFYGRGCGLMLQSGESSGVIDIHIDGVKTHSALDLYYDGTFLAPFYLFPYGAGSDMNKAPANHVVTVKLIGVGGSATSPALTHRRLMIGHAYVYE